MHATGTQTNNHIALLHALRINRAVHVHHAHGETGDVKITRLINVGHLGALAANQRATGNLATNGDALNNAGGFLRTNSAEAQVIKKEQRLRALHNEIVHIHGHAINADGIKPTHFNRKHNFGSNSVGARHKNRVLVIALEHFLFEVQAKHGGETSVGAKHARRMRAPQRGLDEINHGVARVHVHARLCVGETS